MITFSIEIHTDAFETATIIVINVFTFIPLPVVHTFHDGFILLSYYRLEHLSQTASS